MKAEKLKELKKKEGKLTNELCSSYCQKVITNYFGGKDNAQVVVAQAMHASASSKLSITQTELTDIMAELHNIKRPSEHESVDQRYKNRQ